MRAIKGRPNRQECRTDRVDAHGGILARSREARWSFSPARLDLVGSRSLNGVLNARFKQTHYGPGRGIE